MGVLRLEGDRRAPAARLAALSRGALDRPLQYDAELILGVPGDEAVVLGAFQRRSEIEDEVGSSVVLRRGSGGAEARVGPGTLWMQLALARPDALVACEPSRLSNRYVRPMLRALTKSGALAHYFDRDWLSVSKRPVGMIAFAHDATSGRAFVEAIVAIETPFAVRARSSYLGKSPATLAELGVASGTRRIVDAVIESYASTYARTPAELDEARANDTAAIGAAGVLADPPWTATRDEAIGTVAAGRDLDGRMRVGGELMVSRDALARLEDRLTTDHPKDLDGAVDETLGARGVALLGVRSLVSIRDVIAEALDARQ